MSEDQQTFKRAMSAALVGLAAQVLLTAVTAMVGIYAQSSAVNAAALYMLGGVPVWIVLAILFHQQRQERVEALEAEQMATADAASAAIFNEAGDQLRVARKRLNNLIKYWLNIVSLGVAVYLLTVGGVYLFRLVNAGDFVTAMSQPGGTVTGLKPGANVAAIFIIALVVGFVAFLVARYVAGMTQVKSWQPLRGGAGFMMGSFVVSLLIMAAGIVHLLGLAVPGFVVLAVVIPCLMILLGLEIVLGFIFGLYRPRKPGEAPKPAFESRLLGWLTRPESIGKIVGETLNYQFGFEISSSWFYRLLSRSIVPLIVLGGAIMIGLTSFVIVGPHENAVVTRFGKLQSILPSGPHFKLPWPIERAEKFDVAQVQTLDIASSSKDHLEPGIPILWTNEHGGAETNFYVTPEPVARAELSNDTENSIAAGLIGVRVTVQYRIEELAKYVSSASAEDPVTLFNRQAESVVNRYFATHDIASLLSASRTQAGTELQSELQEQANQQGLRVLTVALTSLHPPQAEDVAKTFLSRIESDITRQATIEEARKDEVTTLTSVAGSRERALQIFDAIRVAENLKLQISGAGAAEAEQLAAQLTEQQEEIERLMDDAGGEAAGLIYRARADRWRQSLGEEASVLGKQSQLEAYRQSPEYFRAREYFRALTEGLADPERAVRKVIMTTPDSNESTIRLNLEDEGAGLNTTFDTGTN